MKLSLATLLQKDSIAISSEVWEIFSEQILIEHLWITASVNLILKCFNERKEKKMKTCYIKILIKSFTFYIQLLF